MRSLPAATLLLATATSCWAADFDLSATIRAGLNDATGWELGIGPLGNNAFNNASLNPYLPDASPRQFQLGYTSSSNTAYLRYTHLSGASQMVTFSPGGPGLGARSVWTIPVGSLFVTAEQRIWATSITAGGLTLSGGVQVLQPLSATTLTASRGFFAPGVTTGLTSPAVFRTGASGDWMLSGTISFSGLSPYVPFGVLTGAQQSQLQMGADIYGTTAPEPPMSGLLAVGLIVIGLRARRKRGEGEAR